MAVGDWLSIGTLMNRVHIIRAGLCSTVQDLGRATFRHLGVACGGAMDRLSHELANQLVGNSGDPAIIYEALFRIA